MRPMKKVTVHVNGTEKETFVFQKASDAKKLAKAVMVLDHVDDVIIEDHDLVFDSLGHALMEVVRMAD